VIGKLTGVGLGLLMGWFFGNASLIFLLGTAGLVIGHLLVDRDSIPPPASEMPPTKEQLLGKAPRQQPHPLPRPAREPNGQATAPVKASREAELARALCPIFIEVARADGEVSQDEVRVVREFFSHDLELGNDDMEVVRVALKDALKAPPADVEELVTKVRAQVRPSERLMAVNALYELALVDGELKRAESDALKRVVAAFNLSEEQLREITALQLGSGSSHYTALGLKPDATDDEIKGAFRRLATENHPDRVASLGPGQAEAAAQRFRKVKDAYEELKKLRGL
jgi:DnaJ like chaperone protein